MIAAPDIAPGKTMGLFGTVKARVLLANGIQDTGDIALAGASAKITEPPGLSIKAKNRLCLRMIQPCQTGKARS